MSTKIKITFTIDIIEKYTEGEDLLEQIDNDIVNVMMEALEDNLQVEGYEYNGDTISSEVSYA